MRGLQHVPAGLVPFAGEDYGAGWFEPSTWELWPGYWGAPLLGDASAQLDPHAGSPDAYVIHRPDESVAQWGRDDRWWLSAGHRAVTWEQCTEDAGELAACPMQGHDLDMGGDLELDPGCWVSDTLGDFTQLRVHRLRVRAEVLARVRLDRTAARPLRASPACGYARRHDHHRPLPLGRAG